MASFESSGGTAMVYQTAAERLPDARPSDIKLPLQDLGLCNTRGRRRHEEHIVPLREFSAGI